MRAMILAAGYGTRLKPLTDHTPKPLVPLLGRPMISYALDLLQAHGYKEVLINIHYHSEQMKNYIKQEQLARPQIALAVQDESAQILGSGGAVLAAANWLFGSSPNALILNADALVEMDLQAFADAHLQLVRDHSIECTLAVMAHADAGRKYNAFSVKKQLITDHVLADPSQTGTFFHFPGFYFIHEKALLRLKNLIGAFCIVQKLWKPLIAEKKLGAWEYRGYYQDLGTVQDLARGEVFLKNRKIP